MNKDTDLDNVKVGDKFIVRKKFFNSFELIGDVGYKNEDIFEIMITRKDKLDLIIKTQ